MHSSVILLAAPRFAFLDRIDTTLGLEQLHRIMRKLSENSINSINKRKPTPCAIATTLSWNAVRMAGGRGGGEPDLRHSRNKSR